jgi:hypothetical protein
MDKVTATPEALQLLEEIVADHGPVLFHQSGGCCDGSSPMCYPQGDFIIGDRDVKLGEIGGAPFYISASQYEAWWDVLARQWPGTAFPDPLYALCRRRLMPLRRFPQCRAANRTSPGAGCA